MTGLAIRSRLGRIPTLQPMRSMRGPNWRNLWRKRSSLLARPLQRLAIMDPFMVLWHRGTSRRAKLSKQLEGEGGPALGIATARKLWMKRKRTSTGGNEEKLKSETASASLNVVVETPKGSRNKFAFDPGRRAFVLRKVLPEGMKFPHDFGFIPSTRGEDGDPLDVLIFLDEPTFPGCVVEVRLIGLLEGEKSEDGRKIADHRFLAVANESRAYSDFRDLDDLSDGVLDEIEQFFENYQQEPGREFKVVARHSANEAARLLAASRKHPKP